MQDIFIEYMVRSRATVKTVLLKIAVVVAGVVVALAALLFSGYLGPLSFLGAALAMGAVYGAYYLITSMNLEYEYSITNGEMDVDKIIAQRRRKRLATVKFREVEAFGRYKAAEHAGKSYENKIFACDFPENTDLWYCVARVTGKGIVFLVFNASERMLEAIKPYLPRPIFHEVFKRVQ